MGKSTDPPRDQPTAQPRDQLCDQPRDQPRDQPLDQPCDLPHATHPRGLDPLQGLRGLIAFHVTVHHFYMEWGR